MRKPYLKMVALTCSIISKVYLSRLNNKSYSYLVVLLLTPAETTSEILKFCLKQGITGSHKYQFITTDFSMLALEQYIEDEQARGEIVNGVIDIGATLSGDSNAVAYQQFVEHMNATFFERFNTDVIYGEPVRMHLK